MILLDLIAKSKACFKYTATKNSTNENIYRDRVSTPFNMFHEGMDEDDSDTLSTETAAPVPQLILLLPQLILYIPLGEIGRGMY